MILALIGFGVLLLLALVLTVAFSAVTLAAANGFMVGAAEVALTGALAAAAWLGVYLTWPFNVTMSLAV